MATFLSTPTQITLPTGDGTYQDVDLSASVPANATGVIIEFWRSAIFAPDPFGIRAKGDTYDITPDIKYLSHDWLHVGVDADRVIQVKEPSGEQNLTMYIHGYWGQEATFLSTPVDVTPGTNTTWTDVDISSDSGSDTAIGAILRIDTTGTSENFNPAGVRNNGSTDANIENLGDSNWLLIGVDENEIFEAYVGDNSVLTLYLVGYITAGCTFVTNSDDVTIGSSSTWTTDTFSATSEVGVIVRMESSGANEICGLATDNSDYGQTTLKLNRNVTHGVVGTNGSNRVELYRGSFPVTFGKLASIDEEADLTVAGGGGGAGSSQTVMSPGTIWKPV